MRWLSKYGSVVVECKFSDMMATREWRVFWEEKWGYYPPVRFYSLDSDLHTALGNMIERVLDHQKEKWEEDNAKPIPTIRPRYTDTGKKKEK